MPVNVINIKNSPIDSNCFILYDKDHGDKCLIIDPGSQCNNILYRELDKLSLFPEYIILTHEHFDHIWGCNSLVERYKAKIVTSTKCSEAIRDSRKNLSLFYDQKGFSIQHDNIHIDDLGNSLHWLEYDIHFLETKGHTQAGLCFYIDKFLFTGDTLIKGKCTITKLYSGSKIDLQKSLCFLATLKGNGLIVCPGHGDYFDLDSYNLNLAIKQ